MCISLYNVLLHINKQNFNKKLTFKNALHLYVSGFFCTAADLQTVPVDMQWSYQKTPLEAGYISQ